MQEAVPVGKGNMIALLTISEITKLINYLKNNLNICEIANDNADGQIIVSGDTRA